MKKLKRLASVSTEDRVSELPDAILCHILSFLPTKLAVSTSILSKRWKPIWLSVTTFDIFEFFPDNVLCSVLQSRDINLPIILFRILCSEPQIFNLLINSAIPRGVQTLELNLTCVPLKMKTLFNILTCNTLTLLKLTNIFIEEDFPQRIVSSIKTLHLNDVHFRSEKHMICFFLAFPVLEELLSNGVHVIGGRKFIPQTGGTIHCLPNLLRANISDIQLISFFSLSRALILNVKQKPLLSTVQIPMFYHLTQMELVFNVEKTWLAKWKWILKMLQQSPNLQHLIIHQEIENENGINDKNWEEPQIVPECLSSQLRTCLFRWFRGTKCELKFIKYVMRNSKLLSLMTIYTSSSIILNTKDKILHNLAVCPRSCNLIFDCSRFDHV
ncbi:unnamed protein product [Vicia faba]|uniref:F-box domain-containing protein n=1 Tax=Vicia faba TaxID=3906 RepID=A0AAV0Z1Q0_VICFA|nr:unnamed protein product [Vicia faba]